MLANTLLVTATLLVIVILILIAKASLEGVQILREFKEDLMYTKTNTREEDLKEAADSLGMSDKTKVKEKDTTSVPTKDRSWEPWEVKARRNKILVPYSTHATSLKRKLSRGTIIRKHLGNEAAYAELVSLINIDESHKTPTYKWVVKVLPFEAYDAVKHAEEGHDHLIWKNKEARNKFSNVPENDFDNQYDLRR